MKLSEQFDDGSCYSCIVKRMNMIKEWDQSVTPIRDTGAISGQGHI